jgi:hypothetical protein
MCPEVPFLFSEGTVDAMYVVYVRIDDTLPWIELKGNYQTRSEARRAAEDFRSRIQAKIVNMPEKSKPLNAIAIARA